MIRRSWKSFLASMALVGGMTAANSAFAYDGCGVSAGCGDCQQCEQIFADAGQKLTEQLAGMSCCGNGCGSSGCGTQMSCCAPTSICDPACAAPCGDLLSDGCGEGCGEGSGSSCGDGLFTVNGRKLGVFGDWGHGVTLGGWTQFGYQNRPDGAFTGNGAFNSVNFGPGTNPTGHEWNNFQLNQQAFYLNKTADGSNGLGLGFRAETIFGVDGNEAQSFGNVPGNFDYSPSSTRWNHGIYEYAIPQLYAEAALGDLSVKIGHFYTPVGYEVIPSGGNFFLSRQLTFYNSEPFTHTGALGTYKAGDNLQVLGGWVAGMDTGFNRNSGGSAFLGGFIYQMAEKTTLTYMMTGGNLGWRGDGSINSIVLTHGWTDKFSSVHQFDVLSSNASNKFGYNFQTNGIADNSTGLINYAFYQVNDKIKLGARQEWYKADGTSYNTMTWGFNYFAMKNLVIRPEIRQMWAPGAQNSAAAPGHHDLFNANVLGVDAILTY